MLQVILAIQSCHVGVPEMGCRDAPFRCVIHGTIEANQNRRSWSPSLAVVALQQSGLGKLLVCQLLSKNGSRLFPCSWWKDQLNNATKVCFNILKLK